MSADPKKVGLMDPKTMDGPVVRATVHDVFHRCNPYLSLTYHCATTGAFLLNTVGVVLGAGLYGAGVRRLPWVMPAAAPNMAALSASTGLVLGGVGMGAGLLALAGIASRGAQATPIPFTPDGVQQRVQGLQHNYMVRLVDLSCWTGMGLAAVYYIVQRPSTVTAVQALSLGSALGGLGAFGCLYSLQQKNRRELETDDE